MARTKRTLSDEATAIARIVYLDDGYTISEISRLMGVAEGAVRYAVRDILRHRKYPTALINAIEGGNRYIPSLLRLGYCYASCKYYLRKYHATKTLQPKQTTRHI